MKTVFFGASKHVLPILDVLKDNFDLSLVITTETLATEPVSVYCKEKNVDFITIKQFNNLTIEKIKSVNAPLAALAYFGLILPKTILNLFPKGIINVHPSLLPKYRGPTPGQSAILAKDKTTGVTIIQLDSEVDHGPILAQEETPILPHDTSDTLYARLFAKGAQMLPNVLHDYIQADRRPHEQDHDKAIFTKQLTRDSGYFDSNNPPPPDHLDRMIRAYYPWPGVWTYMKLRGKEVRVKFLPASPKGGTEKKVQPEGKKPMSYKDFLNGYPQIKEWKLLDILAS